MMERFEISRRAVVVNRHLVIPITELIEPRLLFICRYEDTSVFETPVDSDEDIVAVIFVADAREREVL